MDSNAIKSIDTKQIADNISRQAANGIPQDQIAFEIENALNMIVAEALKEDKKMGEVVWLVKKYGQVTQVYVDGKLAYASGNTVKAEASNLRKLIEIANIENTKVEEIQK